MPGENVSQASERQHLRPHHSPHEDGAGRMHRGGQTGGFGQLRDPVRAGRIEIMPRSNKVKLPDKTALSQGFCRRFRCRLSGDSTGVRRPAEY